MEVNVTVQKRICNIVFDHEDHYLRDFAEQLALNGFNVSQAFNKAYLEYVGEDEPDGI